MVGLFGAAVFTRLFAPADYGRYSLVLIVVNLLVLVSAQWLQQATNRYLPGELESERLAGWEAAVAESIAFIGAGLVVLGALAAAIRGWILAPAWRPFVIPAAALALGIALTQPLLVVLQAKIRPKEFARFRLLAATGSFGLSLVLVLAFRGDVSMLLWGAAIPLLILVLPLWKTAGLPSFLPRRGVSREARQALKRLVAYGVPLTGWALATSLLFFGDRFLIQLYRGEREVGIYSAIYFLISGSVSLVATPLIMASHPLLVRLWESGDHAAVARWLETILELFLLGGGVFVAAIGLFAGDISRLMLGPRFREGATILPVVASAALAWQLAMYVHKPLEFAGRTMRMLLLCLAVFALDVALNLVGIPSSGYAAAAYALLAANAVYLVLARWSGKRVLRWRIRAPVAAAAAVIAFASPLLVRFRGRIDATAGAPIGFAASCAALVLLILVAGAVGRRALNTAFRRRREPA